MAIVRYNDPTSGRPQVADEMTPTTPTNTLVGNAGSAIAQMMIDNVADASSISALQTVVNQLHGQYMVFEGVADWNGTSGTDNGAAFHAIITAAIAQSGHTTIMVPQGRYYIGSSNLTYNLSTELTIQGIGEVELAGQGASSMLTFNGALVSNGSATAVTLNGDHNRTARVMPDGRTYYDGVETFTFNEDHGADVGDWFMMYDQTATDWNTGFGVGSAPIYHIGQITAVPTTKSITVGAASFFDFLGNETGAIVPYWGPLHLKNIKFNNFRPTGDNSCIRTYRICNSSVEGCEFIGANPNGQSDHFLISDSENWKFSDCKWTNARYGILSNRSWHLVAKNQECNDLRHFVSPGFTSAHGLYENIWGVDNVTLVNSHASLNQIWRNVRDLGGYSGVGKNDMFNCRAMGFTLDNVYWEGYADGVGNKNIYLGAHVNIDSKYEDLLWRFPITIRNTSFHTRTPANVNIRRGGVVTINGFCLGGGGYVELGNSNEGIVSLNGTDSIIGASSVNLFKIGGDDTDYERFSGAITSATATTATLPTAITESSGDEDFHKGSLIHITGGTGAGQNRRITAYTVVGGGGSDHVITVDTWDTTPDATSTYEINCTNLYCGDAQAVGTNWGIARKRLTDQETDGDADLYPYRVRVHPIVRGGEESTRYESVLVTILATTQAGTTPGFSKWEYLFEVKSVPSRGVLGPYLLNQTPQRKDRIMTLDISDVLIDGDVTAEPAWFEFTLTMTTEENAIAIFCQAESIGAN